MARKFIKWIALLMICCCMQGCYVKQRLIPLFLPKSEHDKFLDTVAWLHDNGVQVVVLGDTIRIIVPVDYFFYQDSADFIRRKAPVMWQIAGILNACGNAPVKITGHTDDIGTKAHKLRRSYNYAFVIASYMWESGVPWSRMTVRGYADHEDVATFRTVSGSHFNRRVEIVMD